MSETKHTAAPWRVNKECVSFSVIDAYDDIVADIYDEADARLIAAAPELLKAASEVVRLLEYHGPAIVAHIMDTDDNAGQRLRAAIAKAKGEQP